jgi:hypothetical protein
MARGTLDTPVHVQRAAEGEPFYTWRGRVRKLFEPCYLHFESLYTRRDVRRGVAAALIEAVSAIGLPTFAEFRPKWLPDVFERWRVTEENEDEALLWTQEAAGASLGGALSLALDGEVLEAPPFEPASFRITLRATAGGERSISRKAEYRARTTMGPTATRTTVSLCTKKGSSKTIASRSRRSRGMKTTCDGFPGSSRRSSASICATTEAVSPSRESRSRCLQHRRRGHATWPATA